MNSFFEKAFGEAKKSYLESITDNFAVEEELFSKLPKQHKFFRMPYYTQRRYFTVVGGQPFLMTGLTQWTKKIINHRKEDLFLYKWKEDMIKEGNDPDDYAWLASEFGTLVHIIAAHIFSARARKEPFSTVGLDRELMGYMRAIGVSGSLFKDWYKNLCSAIRSLNNFYSRTEMEVFAVEYCVADFFNNICTPLDIICEISTEESVEVPAKTTGGTKKQKQIKRDRWNLNIKARANPERRTGDKYQLSAEMFMFNDYSPDFKINRTGVLSPSWAWKNKDLADCKLHDFTNSFPESEWKGYLNHFRSEPGFPSKDMFDPDLSQNIGDTNVFSVNEFGDITETPERTIEEYIMSFFKKDKK